MASRLQGGVSEPRRAHFPWRDREIPPYNFRARMRNPDCASLRPYDVLLMCRTGLAMTG